MSVRDFRLKVKEFFGKVNPLLLALALVAAVLLIPGRYSLWSQRADSKKLREKQEEYRYYQEEIKKSQKQLDEIKYEKDMLEKYARERYLMKEEDEDLYLLTDPDEK